MKQDFISQESYVLSSKKINIECPSNIALIKYWGKYPEQIPANPSISYTLNNAKTITEIHFTPDEKFSVKTFLAGEEQKSFGDKIEKYFAKIEKYLPWILKGKYEIHTQNTFPHSSGIASSASGFGAIAKGLMELNDIFSQEKIEEEWKNKKASFLARIGSGSACRSLYNGLVVWGETPVVEGSSDEYAVPYPEEEIHPVFKDFHDWVLLIHEGEKAVSSSVGHNLMNTNPYAEKRFEEARQNFFKLKEILKHGNIEAFITLVEHEALTLHAMMMMSQPAFILMKTGTLSTIEKIWKYRAETKYPLFFTLDAGANVHLLFPENQHTEEIKKFIETELRPHAQAGKIIKDKIKF